MIRINASDSNGNASGFNPNGGEGRRICTLGEGVPSCLKSEKNETVSCSGTSFATPIAVAIAATVLGFMDAIRYDGSINLPDDFDDLLPRLRTRSGMEKVLCETCVLQSSPKRASFHYITPWYFLEIEKQSRVGIVLNILRGIPE